MLKGKTVVLGVTGSIAAYKIASLASMLKKQGADVEVIMTKNATNFINPITFESLTGNKCLVDTFDRNFQFSVEHVALAKRASVFLIAPASANVIAKVAHGLADDMLTTTFLACQCPKIIAPAMNTRMYTNPILQDNLKICETYGMEVIAPADGYLACGDTGAGKMPEPEDLFDYIVKAAAFPKDLAGKKILVTAGATMEAIDPVRYITNHSTGKMGYAVAKAAALRGAEVTLVSAHAEVKPPRFVKLVPVKSAREMFEAVTTAAADQDVIVKAAAVADYRRKGEEKGWRSFHPSGADRRYSGLAGSPQEGWTVSLRVFHGDPEYAGEFQGEAEKEESGHDCGQQSEGRGGRFRHGYQCGDPYHRGPGDGASEADEG